MSHSSHWLRKHKRPIDGLLKASQAAVKIDQMMKSMSEFKVIRYIGFVFIPLTLLATSCRNLPQSTATSEWPLEETDPATPSPAEEIRVLEQTSQAVCAGTSPELLNPVGDVIVDGSPFILTCVYSAGHATSIRIERYEDSEAALLVFQGSAEGRNVEDFHGYPSVEWEGVFPGSGSKGRERVKTPFLVPVESRQIHGWLRLN